MSRILEPIAVDHEMFFLCKSLLESMNISTCYNLIQRRGIQYFSACAILLSWNFPMLLRDRR